MEDSKKQGLGLLAVMILTLVIGFGLSRLVLKYVAPSVTAATEEGNMIVLICYCGVMVAFFVRFMYALAMTKIKKFVTTKLAIVDCFIPVLSEFKFYDIYMSMVTPYYIMDKTGNIPRQSSAFMAFVARVAGIANIIVSIGCVIVAFGGGVYVYFKHGMFALLMAHTRWLVIVITLYLFATAIKSLMFGLIITSMDKWIKGVNPRTLFISSNVLPVMFIFNFIYIIVSYLIKMDLNLPLFNILGFILLPTVNPMIIAWTVRVATNDAKRTIDDMRIKAGKPPIIW